MCILRPAHHVVRRSGGHLAVCPPLPLQLRKGLSSKGLSSVPCSAQRRRQSGGRVVATAVASAVPRFLSATAVSLSLCPADRCCCILAAFTVHPVAAPALPTLRPQPPALSTPLPVFAFSAARALLTFSSFLVRKLKRVAYWTSQLSLCAMPFRHSFFLRACCAPAPSGALCATD